jgi:hypothetical protein
LQLAVGSGSHCQDADCRFCNRVLKLRHDGSWKYKTGVAITLLELFVKLGPEYTAAELYAYYNTLATLSVKRPHAWAHPVRQMAATDKWKLNKGRGGRGF